MYIHTFFFNSISLSLSLSLSLILIGFVVFAVTLGALWKTHGSLFYPCFSSLLLPTLLELSQPHHHMSDRKFSLGCLSDMCEYGCEAIDVNVMREVLKVLCTAVTDTEDDIMRQNAAYALELVISRYIVDNNGQLSAQQQQQWVASICSALTSSLSLPDSASHPIPHDTTMGCLSTLLRLHFQKLSDDVIAGCWGGVLLPHLPMNGDEEEAAKVLDCLAEFFVNGGGEGSAECHDEFTCNSLLF